MDEASRLPEAWQVSGMCVGPSREPLRLGATNGPPESSTQVLRDLAGSDAQALRQITGIAHDDRQSGNIDIPRSIKRQFLADASPAAPNNTILVSNASDSERLVSE
ncbi:MAG TPA: hypothetical protein VIV60_10640 [Polyangiaceae bacterium]